MESAVIILLALCPLVHASSEPQREALLFNQADKNQDGELTESDLRVIFLDFDVNNDSQITEKEFETDWTTVFHLGNTDEAHTLFARADINDDNVLNDKDLPGIFAYFDMDGDNLVSMSEFLTQWADLQLDAPDTVNIQVGP